jgi:hypothetical protein
MERKEGIKTGIFLSFATLDEVYLMGCGNCGDLINGNSQERPSSTWAQIPLQSWTNITPRAQKKMRCTTLQG